MTAKDDLEKRQSSPLVKLCHTNIEDHCFYIISLHHSSQHSTLKISTPSRWTLKRSAIILINNAGKCGASLAGVTSTYRSHLLSSGDVLQNLFQLLLNASSPVNHSAKVKLRHFQHYHFNIITKTFISLPLRISECICKTAAVCGSLSAGKLPHSAPFGMPVWKYHYPISS